MAKCGSCGQAKGRRQCPALGREICPICCGTKRLTEIACPESCVYLGAARSHPAAVVKKQTEQDVADLLPTIRHLTERQYQLFFLFQTLIAAHVPEGLVRLLDSDVAEAAKAAAATLETAARGVIYQHTAPSAPAQRLTAELERMVAELRQSGAEVFDREAAIVLRAIEHGAGAEASQRAPAKTDQRAGQSTRYLERLARLLQVNRAASPAKAAADRGATPLILP